MKGYQALPEEQCGNCKYFRLHYICRSDGLYSALSYGHCVYPRLKKRCTEEHCPHWTAKDEETSRS